MPLVSQRSLTDGAVDEIAADAAAESIATGVLTLKISAVYSCLMIQPSPIFSGHRLEKITSRGKS